MSENTIDGENSSKLAPPSAEPAARRKPSRKAKPAKAGRPKKPAAKQRADRTNKKAEVIALMKRAKGATLAEIMKATDGQPHTRCQPLIDDQATIGQSQIWRTSESRLWSDRGDAR
jgi:hypothetical protein